MIAFLESEGAARHGHGPGRSLLDHLRETASILDRWGQPAWLQHAALVHSVYGTEARRRRLISPARRAEVSELVGERAERVAYLFAAIPRRRLAAGTHRSAPRGPSGSRSRRARCGRDAAPGEPGRPGARARRLTWGVACDRRADDGAAGCQPRSGAPWVRRRALGGLAGGRVDRPAAAYREGLAATDPAARADRLAQAAAACPVAGEPCAWLADAAWRRGEEEAARAWARRARHRLAALGVAWDKRLTCGLGARARRAPDRRSGRA